MSRQLQYPLHLAENINIAITELELSVSTAAGMAETFSVTIHAHSRALSRTEGAVISTAQGNENFGHVQLLI